MNGIQLDNIDFKILEVLQQNAKISNALLAKKLNMAPSAILERVKKLENKQAILSYHTSINPQAIDKTMLAFIFIKAQDIIGDSSVGKDLAAIPDVLEVHDIAGDDGYLIKVRTKDTQTLVELMRNSLSKIEGIISTRTTIVLETIKETSQIPIQ